MKKLFGFAFIGLGIFLEVMWLGVCFGSVLIGILLLIFAPRVLFFPFNFFLLVGLRLIYSQAFRNYENASRNGQNYSYRANFGGANANFGTNQNATPFNQMHSYYEEIESSASDSMDVIKKNYRRLMKEHHYDSLVSKGLPQDMLDFSQEKSKRVNAAYAAIKEARA